MPTPDQLDSLPPFPGVVGLSAEQAEIIASLPPLSGVEGLSAEQAEIIAAGHEGDELPDAPPADIPRPSEQPETAAPALVADVHTDTPENVMAKAREQGGYGFGGPATVGELEQAAAKVADHVASIAKALMQPSVGRIVHFATPEGPRPAIITHVHSDTVVDLSVFTTHPVKPVAVHTSVKLDPAGSYGTWSWPTRV